MRNSPWISKSEFDNVFEWIYSNDVVKREMALSRILAWKSRGKVPLAVQSTFDFVEIQLQEFEKVSDDALRLLYSMAMIRFVNGILDQAQGLAVKSMMGLAENMGLPCWFVEIRHSATHDQLPSLELLRTATNQALDWLYNNYWSCQYTLSQVQLSGFFQNIITSEKHTREKMMFEISSRISDASDLLMFIDFLLEIDIGSFTIWEDAFKLFEKEWKGFTLLVLKRIIENTRNSRKQEKWGSWLMGNSLIKNNQKYILELLVKAPMTDFTVMLYKKLSRFSPEMQRIFGSVLSFSDSIDIDYCCFSKELCNGELEEFNEKIQEIDSFIIKDAMVDIEQSRWSKAVEFKWNIPIGCLPDGSIPNLDLDIQDNEAYVFPVDNILQSQFSVDKVALI